MKINRLFAFLSLLSGIVLLNSCTKAQEDPNSEFTDPPTLQVILPNNGDVYFTSEGPRRQADLHFIAMDDITIDYVQIIVENSAGQEAYNQRVTMRETTLTYDMFRNFSTTEAGEYTVKYLVADTAEKTAEAEITIYFEDRVATDGLSGKN